MAYVRWSSDDFKSDFYIYTSGTHYHLLLAERRLKEDAPSVNENPFDMQTEFEAHCNWSRARFEDIDDPEAGASYRFDTMEEVVAECERLIEKGFCAPDWMMDRLRDVTKQEDT